MRVAYNQERYKEQMNSLGEYFYYSAILDGAKRPSHRKLHGIILPKITLFGIQIIHLMIGAVDAK